jgi:hypothetical protein
MSKMANEVSRSRATEKKKAVVNFMNGVSYEQNPLLMLKMVSASSIFGEPQYYRNGEFAEKTIKKDPLYEINELVSPYSVIPDKYVGMNTSQIMEKLIDDSLSYDFKGTLEWASTLRNDYFMRLNPQVIMVRAAVHPGRKAFTTENPGMFNAISQRVMRRADEPASQLTYWLYRHGNKFSNIPNILKKSWAHRLSLAQPYEVAKYKNTGIGMIDTVRACHASSPAIDVLMKTGEYQAPDESMTWEKAHSEGKDWKWILSNLKLGHMALLRNLRNIFTELGPDDRDMAMKVIEDLKKGVANGKQFPFRYWSAMKAIQSCTINYQGQVTDALEECMDIAVENLPKLKGRTMCLSDNSGSAWGGITSEYGTVTVAEIDNLSSIITAKCSDEGYIGKFGDKLIVKPVSKRNGILVQQEAITNHGDSDVGGGTENGIWIFFRDAIDKKQHWDNIFIYSDQQAGHGGLYGTPSGKSEYQSRGFGCGGGWRNTEYVDVMKLINEYRSKVNPKVNVFAIQTASYTNAVIPEYTYRGAVLYGLTGKESQFADTIIKLWDSADTSKQ